jgi:hypothetical protein
VQADVCHYLETMWHRTGSAIIADARAHERVPDFGQHERRHLPPAGHDDLPARFRASAPQILSHQLDDA